MVHLSAPMRRPLFENGTLRGFKFLVAAAFGVVLSTQAASAATVFVEPLDATGLTDDAQTAFGSIVTESFGGAGHDVTARAKAAYVAKVSIHKDKSRYDIDIDVTTASTKKLVAKKTSDCLPCTIEQARNKLRLLVRTVSLDLADEDMVLQPPAAALKSVSLAPAAPVAPPIAAKVPALAEAPLVSARRSEGAVEYTRHFELMRYAGGITGAALVVVGGGRLLAMPQIHCSDEPGKCAANLVGTVVPLSVSAYAIAGGVAQLAWGTDGTTHSKWEPWLGLFDGAALGAMSFLVLMNDGYGNESLRAMGYGAIPVAAAGAATSIGALMFGTREKVIAFVGPGSGGMGMRF